MNRGVGLEKILSAERAIGVRFPVVYAAKLRARNGGYIELRGDEWIMLPVLDDSTKATLKKTFNDIVRETKTARSIAWFPADAVVIGVCNEDYLILRNDGDQSNGTLDQEVYIWHLKDDIEATGLAVGDLEW